MGSIRIAAAQAIRYSIRIFRSFRSNAWNHRILAYSAEGRNEQKANRGKLAASSK
jgi:hypothetical protein